MVATNVVPVVAGSGRGGTGRHDVGIVDGA